MAEEHKTLSLAEFANRAIQGEEITQALTDGTTLNCRVFTPTQADTMAIQKIMVKLARTAQKMKTEDDVEPEEAANAYTLGFECLRACLKDESGMEIPDPAFVDLYRNLPYKSDLMIRCQELCGVSMMVIPPFDNAKAAADLKKDLERQVAAAERKAKKPNKG